ncbi:MAG TPA: peptidoglycan-binding domain-containing protein [Candidatus Lumbricidophila sp.]|nr:peptidoglycan-binding domain-containing protein [Candidatus Lumbricidophila sp.]
MSEAQPVDTPKTRRWRLPLAITAVLIAAALGWAGAVVFAPRHGALDATRYTTVEVVPGSVGSTLSLNVVAAWAPQSVGTNDAVGVVTSVALESGKEVIAGTVLYAVNLRPVVVAQGSTPSFRDLTRTSEGDDVVQLQQLLATLGFHSQPADGVFDRTTEQAVKAWQRSLGVPVDGVVRVGDIVFIPSLPVRVWLDADVIARGNRVVGGERAVSTLHGSPEFRIPVTEQQSAAIPTDAVVKLDAPTGDVWEATVSGRETDTDGQMQILLAPTHGDFICGDACAAIAVSEQTTYSGRIELVPEVDGLVIPSAALDAKADGTVVVLDASGIEHKVEILASARGMSAITGLDQGTRVRIPAKG